MLGELRPEIPCKHFYDRNRHESIQQYVTVGQEKRQKFSSTFPLKTVLWFPAIKINQQRWLLLQKLGDALPSAFFMPSGSESSSFDS